MQQLLHISIHAIKSFTYLIRLIDLSIRLQIKLISKVQNLMDTTSYWWKNSHFKSNCITFRLIKAFKNSWDGPNKIIIMLMVIGYQACNNSKEKKKKGTKEITLIWLLFKCHF